MSEAPAPGGDQVRELRLAVVCYGGVSLAIYMHGITRELHHLVRASRAYEEQPGHNPFPEASSEHAYWRALDVARTRDDGVVTRVVVDVVSGTSAGGINGIFLAKALAHDLPQDALAQLWFEKGDIRKLVGGWSGILRAVARLTAGAVLPRVRARPPLDGNRMLRWLYEALRDMDAHRPAAPRPLMPTDHQLELFVTCTDYYGYRHWLTLQDPPLVQERRHRHVLRFSHPPGAGQQDRFGEDANPMLAFAARATSSFPGAFPPVSLADLEANLGGLAPGWRLARDEVLRGFFRSYGLAKADPEKTFFVDGGVLDNAPFGHAIDAIERRKADVEVQRRLLYLQPDPGEDVAEPAGDAPTLPGTIWGGLSSIAGSQPILDELLRVRRLNERLERINDIVEHSHEDVAGLLDRVVRELEPGAPGVGEQMPHLEHEQLVTLRDRLYDEARQQAGYLYSSYVEFKVHAVLEQLVEGVCITCQYPPDSNQRYFTWLVIRAWAHQRGWLGKDVPEDRQLGFLQRLDFGFALRRLRFVIRGINAHYETAGSARPPSRADLNAAKKALYGFMTELERLIEGRTLDEALQKRILTLFTTEAAEDGRTIEDQAAELAATHASTLDDIERDLGELLHTQRQQLHANLYEEFRRLTSAWRPEVRRDVVVRYLGFPFWDALIYPMVKLSRAAEMSSPLQVVRVSPVDARRLDPRRRPQPGPPPTDRERRLKLAGMGLAHFGAFFDRDGRETDYLWGRLDGAERLMHLLLGRPDDSVVLAAFRGILDEEEQRQGDRRLRRKARALIRRLRQQIEPGG